MPSSDGPITTQQVPQIVEPDPQPPTTPLGPISEEGTTQESEDRPAAAGLLEILMAVNSVHSAAIKGRSCEAPRLFQVTE
jgi:hypothetical protein